MTFFAGFGLVLLFFFLVYCLFLLRVLSGLSTAALAPFHPAEMVSVIIAVRNEELMIAKCLESILAQDYPRESYEIIIVDDGSSDATVEISRGFERTHSQLKVITRSGSVGSKRTALLAGIKEASGDVLLFTDGDCSVKPGWISGMAGTLRERVHFVAGPVVEAEAPGLLQRLSRIEFLGIIGVAAGLTRSGNPIFCNGANIAYRKSAFEAIGGFGEGVHFSDDEVILQRFHVRDERSVSFTFDHEAIVTTPSPRSVKDFWNQRVRWSSKGGVYEKTSILARLVFLYFFFLVLFAGLALSLSNPDLITIVIPILAVKFLLDWLVIHKTARLLNQPVSLLYLFIAEVLHVPYIVLAALQGQIGSLRWKGAPVRK
ncbi:MAG: glycosyltransferase [Bacteroidota bacterium]